MLHLPTGIEVFINGRDQHKNRRKARVILTERVNAQALKVQRDKRDAGRRAQLGSNTRDNKIRTYNFIESCVIDHPSGRRSSRIHQVMRGRFDLIRADDSRPPPNRGHAE
jgi:peptide chain release factor 1